jgi:hypothetical protein
MVGFPRAIEVLREGLAKHPTSPALWKKLFEALLRTGDFSEVRSCYDELRSNPDLTKSSSFFSCFYVGCGAKAEVDRLEEKPGEAVRSLEEALGRSAFSILWRELCDNYGIKNDLPRAVEVLGDLLRKAQEDLQEEERWAKRRQFRRAFINDEIMATSERFTVWYGLDKAFKILSDAKEQRISHDSSGWTEVHIAAHEGYPQLVDLLLKRNDRYLASTDGDDRTALHFASMKGHLDVVDLLLERGADINKKDSIGFTALNLAIERGNWEIVRRLRQAESML